MSEYNQKELADKLRLLADRVEMGAALKSWGTYGIFWVDGIGIYEQHKELFVQNAIAVKFLLVNNDPRTESAIDD